LDSQNVSEDNYAADDESGIEQNNGIEDPECPEQQHVSGASHVPGMLQRTQKSKTQADNVFVMVNAIEIWRNKGVKKK